MNKRQERALEVFLYVTFAIALFAGVGNTKSDTSIFPAHFEMGEYDNSVLGYHKALTNDDWQEDVQLQSRINFFGNNDKVNALGRRELAKHARVLRSNPHLILNIIGHSDNRGSSSENFTLGEKRAKQVYELLVVYGTPEEQLIVDIDGEFSSVHDGAKREESRYVELQYLNMFSAVPQH